MRCYEREDLVMDIGLHKGEDSAHYLKNGFKVVAIEADPDLISHCKSRFQEFIESGDLTIVEGAVSDVRSNVKEIVFYKNPKLSLWRTTNPDWQERNQKRIVDSVEIKAKSVKFSEVLMQFGIPLYRKIDIEGADKLCLNALHEIDVKPQFVSIEAEKVDLEKLEREFDLLESDKSP